MFDSFTQEVFMEHDFARYHSRHWKHSSEFIPLNFNDVRHTISKIKKHVI